MVLSTGGGEATNPEKMEDLYASIRYWGMEEEDNTTFPSWKGDDDYQDPADPKALSANLAAVFPGVAILLNSRVERTVMLNEITQDNNKVQGDKINEIVKLHRLERRM